MYLTENVAIIKQRLESLLDWTVKSFQVPGAGGL